MCHIEEYVGQAAMAAGFLETVFPDSPHRTLQLATELGGLLNHIFQKQTNDYSDTPLSPASAVGPQREWFVVKI